MGIFGCLVKAIANSAHPFSEGLPVDDSGLVASHIFDPWSQEALEDAGERWLPHHRASCPRCHGASPATAPPS